jgi:hypothetical protein
MSLYNRKKWRDFRQTCLENANNTCERCGVTSQNATLQVHHPYYENGHMPWEYDPKFCVVMCKGCHSAEHGITAPKTGWTLVYSDWENGEKSGPAYCENCGAGMEWHNVIYHPKWGEMIVGYECADKLGLSEIHALKLKMERMRTFIYSPKWSKTKSGYTYRFKGNTVTAFPYKHGWKLVINHRFGGRVYKDMLDAKKQAFFYLESI